MTDATRLLQEIATAQDHAALDTLERAASRLIEELTAHLADAIRERREYLARRD